MFSPELGFWSLDLWKKVLCPDQASLGDLSSDTDSFFLSLSLSLSLSLCLSVCLSFSPSSLSLTRSANVSVLDQAIISSVVFPFQKPTVVFPQDWTFGDFTRSNRSWVPTSWILCGVPPDLHSRIRTCFCRIETTWRDHVTSSWSPALYGKVNEMWMDQ